MPKSLNDFVKDNAKFLRLDDGEVFDGVFSGYQIAASTFDPEKETVVYKFKYEDGKQIYFQTASVAVAKVFSKFRGGEKIRLKREGIGTKTKYVISSPDITIHPDELKPDDEVPF